MGAEVGKIQFIIEIDDKGSVVIKDLDGKIRQIVKTSQEGTTAASAGFGGMWKSMFAGQIATNAVMSGFRFLKNELMSTMTEAGKNAAALRQMDAVLKSTGGAAGIAREELIRLSEGFQKTTTYSHDTVMEAQNLMLTFTNVNKSVFPQSIQAILDMSTAMGQDLKGSAIQVGKALQDPILGVTALRRVGVNFNEAQTEVIKNLVKTGQAAKAQALILKELTTEFGGSAAAAAQGFGGALKQVLNIYNDFKEEIGKGIMDTLKPALVGLRDWMISSFGSLENAGKEIGQTIGGIALFLVNVIKFMIQFRDVIVLAGKAWLLYFALEKISSIASGWAGGLAKMAGGTSVFAGKLGVLQTGLKNLPAVGMAAFAGWEIGRLIGEITGLDGVLQGLYTKLFDLVGINKQSTAVIGDEAAARQKSAEAIRSVGKELGASNAKLTDNARLIMANKEAFDKLDPATQAIVKRLANFREEVKTIEPVIEDNSEALKKYAEDLEKFQTSLKVVTKEGIVQMNKETLMMIQTLKEYGVQVKFGGPVWEAMWTQAMESANKYVQAGQKIPPMLKGILDALMPVEKELEIVNTAMHLKGPEERAWKTIDEEIRKTALGMGDLVDDTGDWKAKSKDATDPAIVAWEQIKAKIDLVKEALSGVNDLFKNFGIDASGVTAPLGNMVGAFETFKASQKSFTAAGKEGGAGLLGQITGVIGMAGAIGAGISAVISLVKTVAAMFKGDGVGEAIKRENAWMKLTDEQMKKLRELEKQYKSTHAATSAMLDQIIKEADITVANFDKYAGRMHEILADVDQGKLTASQAAGFIGSAWSALSEKMKSLNLPGISKEMLKTIQDVQARGIKVAEISAYILSETERGISALSGYYKTASDSQEKFTRAQTYSIALFASMVKEKGFTAAVEAMSTQLDEMEKIATDKGWAISGALREALDFRKMVVGLPDVMAEISSTTTLLESLGNTGQLTGEIFSSFQKDVKSQFDAIVKGGYSEKQALQAVGSELSKVWWYSQQYGFSVDAATQNMIDQGIASGAINAQMIPAQDKMVSVLESIAKVLGADIPYALDGTKKAAESALGTADQQARDFSSTLDGLTRQRTIQLVTQTIDNSGGQAAENQNGGNNGGGGGGGGQGWLDLGPMATGFAGVFNKPTNFSGTIAENGPEGLFAVPMSKLGKGSSGSGNQIQISIEIKAIDSADCESWARNKFIPTLPRIIRSGGDDIRRLKESLQ